MTPEEKSLLERTLKLAEENNKILISMRRISRWSAAMRIAYWVVILLAGIGAIYFIQPYFNTMYGLYNPGQANTTDANSSNSFQDAANSIKDLLK